MFRSRGENVRFVYVLLFLNVAFFLLEYQDKQKYEQMFAFEWDAVLQGEVWRLVTYQFTQEGSAFLQALSLFVTLLLLYMMGSELEEEWGSFHFMTLFTVSTLGSAGVAAWIGIPLLGTYFVYFTLLFIYAAAFPHQTFYLLGAVPVRVRVLALFSLAVLLYGVWSGGAANLAAFGGAVCGYGYYLTQRVRVRFVAAPPRVPEVPRVKIDTTAITNSARYAAVRQALSNGADADLDLLLQQCERDTVANVNICPPADFKPDGADGYCIRCEGFAECSARYLRLNRRAVTATA
ncbi:MAG TPA: rhomboid family intramembrane serine protease [Thermoanaerobaculia bacterium]